MDAITVDRISKTFGEVTALHDVSLTAAPGEFVTLLGPSGCGKTTTLRALAGLERPDSGRIVIDGREVSCAETGYFMPPERRGLGMVFQSYAIWPHMTVFQNVAYPLKAKGGAKADMRARVDQTLELVGLAGAGPRPATNLSGGPAPTEAAAARR